MEPYDLANQNLYYYLNLLDLKLRIVGDYRQKTLEPLYTFFENKINFFGSTCY